MSSPEPASGFRAPSGAVFLSYASQDAEAVRRVAEALRAAGVEVWFDQNELVGGDAWDQKIRGQIKACALFVPVISAATQARREGYFRLEWKLAAQRTHMISERQAFLLPVVIDGTSDAAADVPEEFRAVQWTRLPGGSSNVLFVQRIQRLLAPPSEAAVKLPSATVEGGSIRPPLGRKRVPWLGIAATSVVVLGVIALGVRLVSQQTRAGAASSASVPGLTAGAPRSPAQALVERAARVLETSDPLNRENVYLAEDMVKRALALEPDNAGAWLVSSQLSYLMVWLLTDNSAQRRELLLQQSKRAVALAPGSTAARLEAINAQTLVFSTRGPAIMADLERDARALVAAEPQNWRAHRVLGLVLRNLLRGEESIAVTRRAYELSGKDPGMAADLINVFVRRHQFAEAEIVRAEALTNGSSGRLLCWDAMLKLRWSGDAAASRDALKRWPGWLAQEDRGLFQAWQTWMWSRQPEQALSLTRVATRDMVRDFAFYGPVAALRAQAYELADRSDAAAADWRATLERAERELSAEPDNEPGLYWKAWALARLGRMAEAKSIVALLAQRYLREPTSFSKGTYLEPLQLLVGEKQQALAGLRRRLTTVDDSIGLTRAMLELDPVYDSVRADPNFQAILRDAPTPQAAISTQPPDKSVAVLAFANLSDDKDNEYFSDGVSEELLNVLGRVPGLRVAAPMSAFSFKGKNVSAQQIGQKLNVAYLVNGSVRRAGPEIRVVARLSRADTDEQIWTEKFMGEARNVFGLQDEIAGKIASALSLKLGVASAVAKTEVDPEAFRLYIEGRREWNRRLPASYARAEELLTRAIQLAPKFAQAHAALGDVWELQGEWDNELGPYDQRDGALAQRVRAKAQEALALDPQCAEAHASLGLIGWNSWRFAEGEEELRTALRINPSYASAHQWLGRNLMLQGRLDEALVALRRAADLDPLSPRILDNLAWALVHAGRPDEALSALDRALGLQPDAVQATSIKAQILARRGRRDEAMALVKVVPAGVWISSHWRVTALGVIGDAEARSLIEGHLNDRNAVTRFTALLGLGRDEEALRTIVPGQIEATRADVLLFDPIYDRVRADARFAQALAAIGLTEAHARAQAWRAAQMKAR